MRVPESRPSGPGIDESFRSGGVDGVLPFSATWTHEEGLPLETDNPDRPEAVVQSEFNKTTDWNFFDPKTTMQ